MPGRLHLTSMVTCLSATQTGRFRRLVGLFASLLAGAVLLASTARSDGLRSMLAEAYDEKTADQGQEIFRNLSLSEEEAALVLKGVEFLVEAGYTASAPLDYLRSAQTLATAGIGVRDITNKMREGITKKISQDRLLAAIERRSQALRDARVQVISCEEKGVVFLDRQMAYTVFADYMSRGIPSDKLRDCLAKGTLEEFPALANVVR